MEVIAKTEKSCSHCKTTLPISLFSRIGYNEKTGTTYYNSWCNPCRVVNNRKRSGAKERPRPVITDTQKQCLRCKHVLDFCMFSPSKRGRAGLSAYCKGCSGGTSKEKAREATKKYRETNREVYLSNHRLTQFRRRHKQEVTADGTVTREFLKFLYAQEFCCWCGNLVEPSDRTAEHIKELSSGGYHSAHNLNMACFSCNSSRVNKDGSKTMPGLFSKFLEESKYEG